MTERKPTHVDITTKNTTPKECVITATTVLDVTRNPGYVSM